MGDDERATVGAARRRTPPHGQRVITPQAIPVEVPDEVTGNYQGDELRDIRARRPTPERVQRLEEKHDALLAKLDEHGERIGRVEVAVAGVGGKMEILPKLVESLQDATKAMQQREHVTLTAKVEVDKAEQIGQIETRTVKWKLLVAAVPLAVAAWEALKAFLHWRGVL